MSLWLRGLGPADTLPQYYQAINNMVLDFGKLGVVEARPGVKDDAKFPPVMLVESKPDLPEAVQRKLSSAQRSPPRSTPRQRDLCPRRARRFR